MEETHFNYWLANIPGIGPVTVNKLLSHCDSASQIWSLSKDDYRDLNLGLSASVISNILASKDEDKILDSYERLRQNKIQFISRFDESFPDSLLTIHDVPLGIYVRGNLPDSTKLSVSMVGARNCSDYGKYVARKISEHLAENDIQVISGLARGIDVISQKGALDYGGYSCAVLGCGVDICYPPENQSVYDKLLQKGGIISEYAPHTEPKPGFFPMRNRLISALSDVVVIIEAREKSGSLITADMALEQGKDVYALPGRVTDSLSHGCNRLIAQGAGIILSPREFIAELALSHSKIKIPKSDGSSNLSSVSISNIHLSESEKSVLSAMDFTPQSVNTIQTKTKLNFSELTAVLIRLSSMGIISQCGSHYSISDAAYCQDSAQTEEP